MKDSECEVSEMFLQLIVMVLMVPMLFVATVKVIIMTITILIIKRSMQWG